MPSSVLPLYMMSGMGRRRRRKTGGRRKKRRTRRGGRKMLMIQGSGRKRMRGGFFGSILKGIHGIAKSVPIVSTALGATGNPMAAGLARTLGYGRKRRRATRYGGRMSVYGGRRRKTRMFSVFGGRKRHAPTRKGGPVRIRRKTRRGRGIMDLLKKGHSFVKQHGLISKGLSHLGHEKYSGVAKALGYGRKRRRMRGGFIGGVLSHLLGGRRKKRRTRRRHHMGGRKHLRTYPSGLLTFRRRLRASARRM
jgi:hypothetical protein